MKKLFFSDYRNVYSDSEVFLMIQHLIKKKCNIDIPLKRMAIAELIKHINSSTLLSKTLDLVIDFDLFDGFTFLNNELISNVDFDSYSDSDRIKIKAISFSEAILFNLYLGRLGFKQDPNLVLQLNYGKDYVESNYDEIYFYTKRKVYSGLLSHFDNQFEEIKQDFYKKALSSMAQLDYENATNTFSEEKQLFRDLINPIAIVVRQDNFPEIPISTNSYPKIFLGADDKGYQLFREFVDFTQIKKHKDWSFLFQFLLKDEIIWPVKHSTFVDWLYSEGYVNQDFCDEFEQKRNFTSLNKVKGNALLNTYKQLRKKHFGNC